MFRFLLWRRHYDPVLLSIAVACLVVKVKLDVLLFGFFAGIGIYLITGMHRSIRSIDPVYATGACLYAGCAIVIGLIHGNLPEEIRWIGYPLYLLLGITLFPGVVLIKDPLRQIVLGARAGLILALVVGAFEMVGGLVRIGLGGNAANTAFVIVVVGVLSRMPVRNPPRFLPNSRLWFYLAALAVIMTGTRSVLPVFALGLLFDLFAMRRQLANGALRMSLRSAAVVMLVFFLGLGAIGYELAGSIANRVDYTFAEIDSTMQNPGEEDAPLTGLEIRLTLWQKAIEVIRSHPLIGSGGDASMREIIRSTPQEQRATFSPYIHVHNFVLDELRVRGIIGLVVMLGFFLAVCWRLWASGLPEIREATVLFFASLLTYGALHGLLLADRNMALIAIFLVSLLLYLKKEAFWRNVRRPFQLKTA
ncbi:MULTISPECIES: O-antigen ligase family protein [Chelativorans]|jgi:O-antigen ligase|nr:MULTISPECIES: O-antigen ligase family protein [Chelativorans]